MSGNKVKSNTHNKNRSCNARKKTKLCLLRNGKNVKPKKLNVCSPISEKLQFKCCLFFMMLAYKPCNFSEFRYIIWLRTLKQLCEKYLQK